MIAHRLGMDPVDLRRRNLFELGDTTCTGEILRTSVGVRETLERAVKETAGPVPGKSVKGKVAYGRGVATMHKLTYTPTTSTAVIKMHQDGTVNLLCSSLEMGQGIYTSLRQIVAEGLGIPMDHVSVSPPDTSYTPYDQSTSGSRSVFHMGNAMLLAVGDLADQLCKLKAKLDDVPLDSLVYRDGAVRRTETNDVETAKEIIRRSYGARGATLQGTGTFTPPGAQAPDMETGQSPKVSAFWMYATQVADVEVDLETGKVKVLKLVAVHDAGRLINPDGAEAQIEGGVAQGLGATLHEEMIVRDGIVTNPTFAEYKIPATLDIPEIVPIFVESFPHEEGPFGAKGLGEPVLAPTSPAIANAIFDATGVRVTSLPITPEKVLRGLRELRK
jgi:carbon-monoxide dehydrogenase large subunit